jgi:hypothetical protein
LHACRSTLEDPLGFFRQEGTARFFFEFKSQAIRAAMEDGKGCNGEIVFFKEDAGLDFAQVQRHRRFAPAEDNAMEQVRYTFQGLPPAVDGQFLDGFPAHEGGHEASQAEDVVEMPMREEDVL